VGECNEAGGRSAGPDVPDAAASAIAQLVRRALGAEVVRLELVPPGLGSRRFYRVALERRGDTRDLPASVMARIDSPEDPTLRPTGVAPEPPLEPIRSLLEERGLPVPARYAADPGAGLELLEDVGSHSLEWAAEALDAETLRSCYAEACGLLPRLQRISASPQRAAAFGRRLDDALFDYKAEQVIAWTLPWAFGRQPRQSEVKAVRAAFSHIADVCRGAPERLAHRDYKAANLHLRQGVEAPGRLVMIDLQGAFLAPPEYDLVCLLRDSHVELAEAWVGELLAAVRSELPDAPDPESFERRFALLTLSRNGKDLSRYLYAARSRGDERYLRLLPRAAATLRAAARQTAPWDPRLARLADIFEALESAPLEPSCEP
jgi:aminoglycoside/choline kinase family phosphotransferase